MILTSLQALSLVILTANLNPGCMWIPNMADIVLENVEYHGEIRGRIDFVGMQKIRYNYYPWTSVEDRNALSLFASKLDMNLRGKIHITQSFDYWGEAQFCLFPWREGKYLQFLLGYQKSVNDSLSCSSWLFGIFSESYRAGNNKMVGITLSQIKKYSDADYFLAIAVRPLDAINRKKATVVLLTVIYNRDGKKVYSKIYTETLDIVSNKSFPIFSSGDNSYYDCTMKLIENQGEQINKDLSFLLTADDAPSPTLEDLHKRLQQPGTIDDDVKYLKEFQGK